MKKKKLSYTEDVYYVISSLIFFLKKPNIIKYFKNYGKL